MFVRFYIGFSVCSVYIGLGAYVQFYIGFSIAFSLYRI